ncbi:MAG: hypothetical protein V3V08_14735 [Nannocystaceae bacterium]
MSTQRACPWGCFTFLPLALVLPRVLAIVVVVVVVVVSVFGGVVVGCTWSGGTTRPGQARPVSPEFPPGQGDASSTSSRVIGLAAGVTHVCALRQSGQVMCWGSNDSAQLGDGSTTSRSRVGAVEGLVDAVEIVAGDGHTCARKRDGTVACWGANDFGQLGDGRGRAGAYRAKPTGVAALRGVVALAAGGRHTCAITSSKTFCWGDNRVGQLGNRDRQVWLTPVAVRAATGVAQLVAGGAHTCARRRDGTVLCWGGNRWGQLGDGTRRAHERPARVRDIVGAGDVAAFGERTCATHRGGVSCWGRDPDTREARPKSVFTKLPWAPAQVFVGGTHTCARSRDAQIACWGRNDQGQLANGERTPVAAPLVASALSGARELALTDRAACALWAGGAVRCWGGDADGVLGNGAAPGKLPHKAVAVLGVEDAVSVASGNAFSCAARRTGEVVCWGSNRRGQLGDGGRSKLHRTPRGLKGLAHVVRLAAGPEHVCAVDRGGEVWCWGHNSSGQAGRSKKNKILVPTRIHGIRGAKDVALGDAHSCALLRAGDVSCWGNRPGGSRGGPKRVGGLAGIVELSAGSRHTCARSGSGSILCWGENERGQIGHGAGAAELHTPVQRPRAVARLTDAVALACGVGHSCAVRRGGKVVCWGENSDKQLGSGTQSHVWTTPVPVRGLLGMTGVGAGRDHTCAFGGERVACWGVGDAGELGVPEPAAETPAQGPRLRVAELAAGRDHTCARLRAGAVRCWGDNRHGQLGTGARGPQLTPARVPGL